MPAAIETDALIIGAGPAALFQVFQLGLLEIAAHIVDPLPVAGGQCIELYPDKPIYDIPGIPLCSGRELVANLLQQIQPFKPGWHLQQLVSELQQRPDGRFAVRTTQGTEFIARCVFIAAGVGAFVPRRLKLDGADALEGQQLFYRLPPAQQVSERHIVVLGDEDPALQACLDLIAQDTQDARDAQPPASVTLLYRRDKFRADPRLVAQMRQACDAGRMRLVIALPQALVHDDGRAGLSGLTVLDSHGHLDTLPADVIVACLGLSPKLGPIADWGLALEHKQVLVDTAGFQTSVPGIFAIGDISSYPAKKKLIACGFYEAIMAAWAAYNQLRPDAPQLLQYTTTSTKLHRLLGVSPTSPS